MNNGNLFRIANAYYRNREFLKAYSIYDWLERQSNFSGYATNKDMACRFLFDKKRHAPDRWPDDRRLLQISNILANDRFHHDADELLKCLPDSAEKLLCRANISRYTSQAEWLNVINDYLMTFGVEPLRLENPSNNNGNILSNLSANNNERKTGPLVTIFMSVFNASNTVNFAVRSLLNQSYENIEIIITDDCSSDNSWEVINDLASLDKRIIVTKNKTNCGTYYSRNMALKNARGKYFTILDSDDYALPTRIERQVKILEEKSSLIGVWSKWLRICGDGEIVFRNGFRSYLHDAIATLMIRSREAKQHVGFWDSVRFAADTEFEFRLRKTFGETSIYSLRLPTTFALFHSASLTSDPITGICDENGISPVRQKYRRYWGEWHSSSDKLYLGFPLTERPFKAPKEMHL